MNRKVISSLIAIILTPSATVASENIYFDPAALERTDSAYDVSVDLTGFEKPGRQLPGIYQVTVLFNNQFKGSYPIRFIDDDGELFPVFTPTQLADWGVSVSSISTLKDMPDNIPLENPLHSYVQGAEVHFDFSAMGLNVSVPQLYMNKKNAGTFEPSRWENGIAALFSNYSLSGATTRNRDNGGSSDNHFLRLDNGLNLGAWRLRHSASGSWSRSEDYVGRSTSTHQWKSTETVLFRDLGLIRSRLALGQTNTEGNVFESVPFTGVRLASEESMLPDNQRNFAPVIRGIAGSSARITIKQNDSTIYQTWVPAGSFEIDDLPAGGSNGDLLVIVTEDSGKTQQFTVAYSSLAVMLREGEMKYTLSAGKYRPGSNGSEPGFGEASVSYGLPWRITGYGGGQVTDHYQAAALGVGVDAGTLGAISGDVTLSRAELKSREHAEGQSFRVQYAKNMTSTGSTVTLAAYRYSTSNFYTLAEQLRERDYNGSDYDHIQQRKNRLQLNLSQRLPASGWGSLYITGLIQDYWAKPGQEVSINGGYSNSWQGIGYTLNYANTRTPDSGTDQKVSVNINIPLSRFLPSAWANYSMNTNSNGNTSNSAGVFGTALERNNLSYSVSQSYQNRGEGNSGSLSLGYAGSYGDINGGYNYSRVSKRVDYGIRGGVLVHSGGMTMSRALSGSMTPAALVRVADTPNVGLLNSVSRTDWLGYAVVPYLSEYRDNSISIDTTSLPEDVDISENIQKVIPSGGAIILADFKAKKGRQALIRLMMSEKNPVPFGAVVSVSGSDDNSSIVGDNGEVYLSGLSPHGKLNVQWGTGKNCLAGYDLGQDNMVSGITMLTVTCR
ncbi:fimbrial biogenesis outer membrane usher protein [Salmonella enterica subsp. enterica]|nr:fimbrial biogenesis outer membrane usher protein [Salmonella enterica]EEC4901395.1 fimbrial biogenesis outer membrane usher protein [Salmonella enterica subsp. enterica serovar Kampala]EGB9339919.1 fimbrial biogenesis outer membrane usher protein [Salmonella enterica]HCB4520150.1 fimbrial biogenesis outer membrane usher protein [Salmonella enterica]HCB4567666.1 fimbrial biogenesis outer membrane usher protein [Salmonella enterica]